ncbi:MAG TPA: ferritin-like domain-containing protein [Bryobacteraceae bacterium]|jgi:hypothetical protein|nr:ferritin-like domain-containing protein [Bryobacteraceae bacterium]
MTNRDDAERLSIQNRSRRGFVQKLGLASAALGVGSHLAKAQSSSGPSDVDILNFALNLEYLEAAFYTAATTGKTIDTFGYTVTGGGTPGSVTGGAMVPFGANDNTVYKIALELAHDEQTHVALLQGAIAELGGAAIAQPAINLNALGFGFGSVKDFLKLARIFEDIGVTAYGGAAPLISNKTILGYAARILATEAEHVGNIRLLVDQYDVATAPLDGADIIPPPSGSQFFSVNSMAITEVRTPAQVLFLAFGGQSGVSSGGFFPSGVNGNPALATSGATAATNDGATLTANPNPIPGVGTGYGMTTISWNAPGASVIQIHVNSPTGPLLTDNGPSGSMATGPWVDNGTQFFLQDVSNGKSLTQANTLAVLTVTTT